MSLFGGIINALFGSDDGSEAAEKDAQTSYQSAQDQMAFQERMSNTAYQRAAKDLEAAGFNPIMSYISGAASTPSGASYSSDYVSGVNADTNRLNANVNSVSSMVSYGNAFANMKNTMANTDLMKTQNAATAQDAAVKAAEEKQIIQNTANSALDHESKQLAIQQAKQDYAIGQERLKQEQYKTKDLADKRIVKDSYGDSKLGRFIGRVVEKYTMD